MPNDRLLTLAAERALLHRGSIRTRTVSRLAGATPRQLQYWHKTGFLEATTRRGSRGTPRLYSWIDYMRVRTAVKLLRHDRALTVQRLRRHVAWLDKNRPDWYQIPLVSFGGSVGYQHDVTSEGLRLAALAGDPTQTVVLDWIEEALQEFEQEGPLGRLAEYSDAVDMHPAVRSGSPVIKGTRLETAMAAEMSERGESPEEIANVYDLDAYRVRRAIEFENVDVAA